MGGGVRGSADVIRSRMAENKTAQQENKARNRELKTSIS